MRTVPKRNSVTAFSVVAGGGNLDSFAHWTFFDPAPPRFAAKAKLALCAQTVVFEDAPLRGHGAPINLNARFRNLIPKLRWDL
jgi:hypothetical protein